MKKKCVLVTLLILGVVCNGFGQRSTVNRNIPAGTIVRNTNNADNIALNWTAPVTTRFTESEMRTFLSFEGASYDPERGFLPVLILHRSLPQGTQTASALVSQAVYVPLDNASLGVANAYSAYIGQDADVKVNVGLNRGQSLAEITILPLRKNPVSGVIEKLVSFSLLVQPGSRSAQRIAPSALFTGTSVLASGTWRKIGVTVTGVYKIDYNFIRDMGIDMATLDPQNIRVYSNGRGQLSYNNNVAHADDLQENAIYVNDGGDGQFNPGDYILFYGVSPNTWTYDTLHHHFHHHVNNYSDTSYYFITTDLGPGKRIAQQSSTGSAPNKFVTSFDDYQFHEYDNQNLIKSGREWYGEQFDVLSSYSFGFNFPNIDMTAQACVEVDLVSQSDINHTYTVTAQSSTCSLSVGATSFATCYFCPIAVDGNTNCCFMPNNSLITVTITKPPSSPPHTIVGWLNYVRVNARRQLTMTGSQMSFRDATVTGAGNVAQYTLNGSPSLSVWDVTDIFNVSQQLTVANAGTLTWTLPADSLREFISFDGSQYFTPTYFGTVANQNLHALQSVNLIIVTNPEFLSEANELAQFHALHDGFSTVVVTPQQIYNEFSSGAQDVTAIRDFARMLYFRGTSASDSLHYLLLVGDGSYDNKRRLSSNTNYIPTFQNLASLDPTTSYVSDEFYGLMDDSGFWDNGSDVGYVDIGVGRLPVQTKDQAEAVVQKIKHYLTRAQPVVNVTACSNDQCSKGGEWRNWICFVADDEDADIHMSQANQLATYVDTTYNNYNIDKIYLDAYPEQQTPGGQRYPDVEAAIDRRMDKGCLIFNFTGHGGELGLTHERVLGLTQIDGYNNICNLPLWVTATCEFSRFDNPALESAGEHVLLNADGGGIGLLSTVRLVYSTPNFTLNTNFYHCVFTPLNYGMPYLGDVYRITMVSSGNNTNNRNFTLLGDPALKLNYPVQNVVTSEINNLPVNPLQPDTLRALDHVTIKGYVADSAGNKITGFNGIIYPSVFDKPQTITTLANDPPNAPFVFKLQKNVLYHGKVSVVNGDFQFSFVVPKDIAYQYGNARISYYADNGQTDASGFFEDFVVGGNSTSAPPDNTGPSVKLFLNDSNFVSGGITNQSPKIYAIVRDSNGVNTVGNGIGHDIVAILDDQTDNSIVLNDYYVADMNSYQSGKIIYPFDNLTVGTHTLTLKVWDVYDNSTTVKTEFVVTQSTDLTLDHVLNYPNPFTTHTQFFFEFSQCCTDYDMMIQVFTVSGKLVKTINQRVHAEGFRSDPIDWDGRDDFGDKIGRGVYIYRVVARTQDGKSAEKYQKLVIL